MRSAYLPASSVPKLSSSPKSLAVFTVAVAVAIASISVRPMSTYHSELAGVLAVWHHAGITAGRNHDPFPEALGHAPRMLFLRAFHPGPSLRRQLVVVEPPLYQVSHHQCRDEVAVRMRQKLVGSLIEPRSVLDGVHSRL